MGCAYRKLGQETAVRKYFAKTTEGFSTPEVSRCYNDQSSGYIYYQGLAFHALDDPPRLPLYLAVYEGYTAPEIARMLDAPVNTVYSWISRGRKLLKEALS